MNADTLALGCFGMGAIVIVIAFCVGIAVGINLAERNGQT